jgi:hypothetical protein
MLAIARFANTQKPLLDARDFMKEFLALSPRYANNEKDLKDVGIGEVELKIKITNKKIQFDSLKT